MLANRSANTCMPSPGVWLARKREREHVKRRAESQRFSFHVGYFFVRKQRTENQ